jgi:hypothetical protein
MLLLVLMPTILAGTAYLRERLNPANLVRWTIFAVLCGSLFEAQLIYRQIGWDQIAKPSESFHAEEEPTLQFDSLLSALYLVPAFHPYFYELAEPYFVTHWVPRVLWSGKPNMESWVFYNKVMTRRSMTTNVTPSIIGQYYMNWGCFGVVFAGLWIGMLTRWVDGVAAAVDVRQQSAVGACIAFGYGFIVCSFRFYAPFYFAYVVFAGVCCVILTKRRRYVRCYSLPALRGRQGVCWFRTKRQCGRVRGYFPVGHLNNL